MDVAAFREFLLWSSAINFGVLLLWSLIYLFAQQSLKDVHTRLLHLSAENFAFAHFLGLTIYKIGIILFNLVPLLVLVLFF
jgi:hypothetical protein